jgi:hypothetical protein
MFRALTLFLARAVLRSETSETGIVRRLRAIGFDAAEPMNLPRFPIHSLTILALGIFLYLLVAVVFFDRVVATPEHDQAGRLMTAVQVAVVRLGTIGLTVWLMQRYPFFHRGPGDPLRFFAYVLNGLIAAAAAAGISISFHLGNPNPLAAGGPLLILLSFMLCTALALCCDDWVAETTPPIWLRLAEAAGCAAAMALGMALVVTFLPDYLPHPTNQWIGLKLVMLFAFPSALAFVVGACVPHIYRSARLAATARRDEASQLVSPALRDSQSSAIEGQSIGGDEDGHGEAGMHHQQRGETSRQRGEQMNAGNLTDRIGPKRRKRAAALMAGSDPRDDHRRVATVEQLVGKRGGSGANGNPDGAHRSTARRNKASQLVAPALQDSQPSASK